MSLERNFRRYRQSIFFQAAFSVVTLAVALVLVAQLGFNLWLLSGIAFALLVFPNIRAVKVALGPPEAFFAQFPLGEERVEPVSRWTPSANAVRNWSLTTKLVVLVFFGGLSLVSLWAFSVVSDYIFLAFGVFGLALSIYVLRHGTGR